MAAYRKRRTVAPAARRLEFHVCRVGWAWLLVVVCASPAAAQFGPLPDEPVVAEESTTHGQAIAQQTITQYDVARLSDRRPTIRPLETTRTTPQHTMSTTAVGQPYLSLGQAAAGSHAARGDSQPKTQWTANAAGSSLMYPGAGYPPGHATAAEASGADGATQYSLSAALAVLQGQTAPSPVLTAAENPPAYGACPDCGDPYDCDTWQLLPHGMVYRSYLAGARESRFHSGWMNDSKGGNIWDISLGGRAGLLRYGSSGDSRPTGFQLGIEGAGLVRLDIDEYRDVDAADFRFGVPLSYGTEVHQVKFAYYHLSSHLGDEFLLKHPGYDRLNFSRDAFVLGYSYYATPELRFYAEADYAFFHDVTEPWAFQLGIDYAPADRTGIRGAPFAAVNVYLREEFNFSGNFVAQAGWAWRRNPASGLFRVGVEYFNGHSEQYSFFGLVENKIGLALWYDY